MIVLVAKYTVKSGHGDRVEAALRRMAPLVKAGEPGCTFYHANRRRRIPISSCCTSTIAMMPRSPRIARRRTSRRSSKARSCRCSRGGSARCTRRSPAERVRHAIWSRSNCRRPWGRQLRVGALDAAGDVVDLAAAHAPPLMDEGLTAEAAARISDALLPGDMVALIEGGRAVARRRPSGARLGVGARRGRRRRRGPHRRRTDCSVLAPVPRPPLLRDFMGFEQHLRNIFPKLGREIPPEWYKLPVYYKGNPGSIAAHGDDIRFRRTAARCSTSSSSWRW